MVKLNDVVLETSRNVGILPSFSSPLQQNPTPFATPHPITSLAAMGKLKRWLYKWPLFGDVGFLPYSTTDYSRSDGISTAMDGFRCCVEPPGETSISSPIAMNVEPPVVYNVSTIKEDWKDIPCLKERRRVQNRNAQVHPLGSIA